MLFRSGSIQVRTDADLVPSVVVDGGPNQQIDNRHEKITIKLVTTYSTCLPMTEDLVVEWYQVQGPSINLRQLVDYTNPYWLTIPNCTLQANTKYGFQTTVYLRGFSRYSVTVSVTLDVMPDDFTAKVIDGDRDHPYNKPIWIESGMGGRVIFVFFSASRKLVPFSILNRKN